MTLPMGAAQQVFDPGPPPPPAGAPNLFALGGDGVLGSAFEAAGFNNVVTDSFQTVFDLKSPQEYCDFVGDLAPPVRAMLAGRPTDQVELFWKTVASKAEAFVSDDGSFGIPNTTPMATGTN